MDLVPGICGGWVGLGWDPGLRMIDRCYKIVWVGQGATDM